MATKRPLIVHLDIVFHCTELTMTTMTGPGIEVSQQPDSWTSKSVATAQSLSSSLTTNNSANLSPYKTSTANLQTAGLSKSQDTEGIAIKPFATTLIYY